MEYNNGVLAGMPFDEARLQYPPPQYLHERVINGESAIEFRMRIESVFSRIAASSPYERIAIVSHGGVINCMLRSFFKMPVNKEFWFKSGDTAIHFIEIMDTERIVHFLNDTSHLDGLCS